MKSKWKGTPRTARGGIRQRVAVVCEQQSRPMPEMSYAVSHMIRTVSAIVCLLAVCSCEAFAAVLSPDARLALSKLLPPGYRTAAVLPCSLEAGRKDRFIAALTDSDPDQHEKPVRLLYLAWNGGWTILTASRSRGPTA
jgi:hypothetical protein